MGHLPATAPLISEPGQLDERMCNYDMFIVGRLVVPPPGPLKAVGIKYPVDYAKNVGKWEAIELGTEWKGSDVSAANILKGPLRRIHSCEVGKCVEAAQGRCRSELLHPLDDHRFVIYRFEITKEDIEAIYNNGRIEIDQCRCCKVVQGRQTDRSI